MNTRSALKLCKGPCETPRRLRDFYLSRGRRQNVCRFCQLEREKRQREAKRGARR